MIKMSIPSRDNEYAHTFLSRTKMHRAIVDLCGSETKAVIKLPACGPNHAYVCDYAHLKLISLRSLQGLHEWA